MIEPTSWLSTSARRTQVSPCLMARWRASGVSVTLDVAPACRQSSRIVSASSLLPSRIDQPVPLVIVLSGRTVCYNVTHATAVQHGVSPMSILTRRVQVLLSPDQLARLQAIAQTRGESVGALIRKAVETVYLRHP